jgi:DNA-binding protein H-NS
VYIGICNPVAIPDQRIDRSKEAWDMAREPKNEVIDNVITALDALTYDQLLVIADKAKALAETKKAAAKQALIAEFQERAQSFGLSLVEEAGRARRAAGRKSTAASGPKTVRYRDQDGNTWSGRGPRPLWLKEALDNGKSIDEFKV